jgi:hypothetical protein
MKDLYKARRDYAYADKLSRSEQKDLDSINRQIAELEQKEYTPIRLNRRVGPTLSDALARIRMWGILKFNGWFK